MNKTPNSNRVNISIYGKRNVGKSSLLNAMVDQNVSVVSDVMGTTTDPVKKAMELLGHCSGALRLPLCEMSKENIKKLKEALKNYD